MGGKIGKSRFWHMRALSSDDFCFYWFDEVQSKTQVHFVVCYAVISSVAYSAHSDVVFVWRLRNRCDVLMLSSFGQQPAWNGCIVSSHLVRCSRVDGTVRRTTTTTNALRHAERIHIEIRWISWTILVRWGRMDSESGQRAVKELLQKTKMQPSLIVCRTDYKNFKVKQNSIL